MNYNEILHVHYALLFIYKLYKNWQFNMSVKFIYDSLFFSSPLAFCKKAVERVRSEKNILNSSVEWSGFFKKKSYVCTM